jgi:hypothetical protein
MAGRPVRSGQLDIAKLDAALAEVERLVRAARSSIQKLSGAFPRIAPLGGRPCGGKPCTALGKAEGGILGVKFDLGGKPCGGGKPCSVVPPVRPGVRKPLGATTGARPARGARKP